MHSNSLYPQFFMQHSICLDYFFQKEGKSKTSAVNISSLPINISHARNHLPGAEMVAKFSAGPTSPNPGPIFIRADITQLIPVCKSIDSRRIIKKLPIRIIKTFART